MENSKIDALLNANKFHIDTFHLMSIPPKKEELKKEQEFQEWLRIEGKKLISVCCPGTANILKQAFEVGITETDLHLFKNSFHKHPLTRFGGNKFRIGNKLEINIDLLLDEIFETSVFFSSDKLCRFFLDSIHDDIQRENKNPLWIKELLKFNRRFNERRGEFENFFNSNNKDQLSKALISNVKESIALGNTAEAIKILLEGWSNADVINLSNRHWTLETENDKGKLTFEEYIRQKNILNDELLKLTN